MTRSFTTSAKRSHSKDKKSAAVRLYGSLFVSEYAFDNFIGLLGRVTPLIYMALPEPVLEIEYFIM